MPAILGLVASAGLASPAPAVSDLDVAPPTREVAALRERVRSQIELAAFMSLPQEHRRVVAMAELASVLGDAPGIRMEHSQVSHLITPQTYASLSPSHRQMLHTLQRTTRAAGQPILALCFAPGTPADVINAFDGASLDFGAGMGGHDERFQLTNRWSTTASGGTGTQGDPIVLTYSFVPDGTFVPNLIGYTGNSNLNAWLNGIYGSPATWQAVFAQVFQRWHDLTGIDYVYEPNDDGSNLNGAGGSLGVRGDLRIAAIALDGNSGVLAYNNFPNDGDMVFDSADNYYNNTTNNSIRLRNIIAHEHGHGMGVLHVCPANGTKLMEPFINTGFDGPQHDDIQAGQRHYGDTLENNNTTAQASPLGTLGNGTTSLTNLSIDDNSDTDFFSLAVTAPKGLTIDVDPFGLTYDQGGQSGNCNTGSPYNSLNQHNLGVRVLGTNGVTVLGEANSNGLGQGESLLVVLPAPGTYYVQVFTSSTTNAPQIYTTDFIVGEPPFIPPTITLVGPAPDELTPGEATMFDLTIAAGDDTIVGGSESLTYRLDGGSFVTVPLSDNGGGSYTATLPAALCGDSPVEYYLSVEGVVSGEVTNPIDGAASPYSALVGSFDVAFSDNFETNMGWTVTNDAGLTDGPWTRGTPIGGGDRGDPPGDADGSGQCYVTDNVDGNSDVDGGCTTLTSPIMDASVGDSTIAYWTWLDNTAGGAPNEDTMTVEVSNNGGSSWTVLEVIGPNDGESAGGWFYKTFDVKSVFANPTDQFRIRFVACDLNTGSVVEAGVDGVELSSFACDDPTGCPADIDGDGDADGDDFFGYLDLFASGDPDADLDGDGDRDADDFFAYLDLFAQGC